MTTSSWFSYRFCKEIYVILHDICYNATKNRFPARATDFTSAKLRQSEVKIWNNKEQTFLQNNVRCELWLHRLNMFLSLKVIAWRKGMWVHLKDITEIVLNFKGETNLWNALYFIHSFAKVCTVWLLKVSKRKEIK